MEAVALAAVAEAAEAETATSVARLVTSLLSAARVVAVHPASLVDGKVISAGRF